MSYTKLVLAKAMVDVPNGFVKSLKYSVASKSKYGEPEFFMCPTDY